jgi:hypothetical protein
MILTNEIGRISLLRRWSNACAPSLHSTGAAGRGWFATSKPTPRDAVTVVGCRLSFSQVSVAAEHAASVNILAASTGCQSRGRWSGLVRNPTRHSTIPSSQNFPELTRLPRAPRLPWLVRKPLGSACPGCRVFALWRCRMPRKRKLAGRESSGGVGHVGSLGLDFEGRPGRKWSVEGSGWAGSGAGWIGGREKRTGQKGSRRSWGWDGMPLIIEQRRRGAGTRTRGGDTHPLKLGGATNLAFM